MKKSVSFLLCIVMILTCLPMVSWAAEDVPEASVTLDLGKGRITIGSDYYRIEDQNQNEIKQGKHTGSYILTGTANPNFLPDNGGGCYVEVYKTTGVDITLDNVNITIPEGKNAHALFVTSADATVDLILEGTNEITGGYPGRYAVDCLGSTLNIRGNGSLTVNSNALRMPEGVSEEVQRNVVFTSKGIAAETITISGSASVTVNGGDVEAGIANSYGLDCERLTVEELGSLTATAGNAKGISLSLSHGVFVNNLEVRDSAHLKANGGDAECSNSIENIFGGMARSCGLYVSGGMTAEDDAQVKAIGGKAIGTTYANGYGAVVVGDLSVSKASIQASSGAAQGEENTKYLGETGLSVSGTARISDGAVVEAASYGSDSRSESLAFLGEDLQVSGGKVMASAGQTGGSQKVTVGMYLRGALTVGQNGGVIARGGEAVQESYGMICQTAKIDDGFAFAYSRTSPRSTGMDVRGEMTVEEGGRVTARVLDTSSAGYGIAAMKPLHIDGGEVSVLAVIDNGGAEETTTNVAIYYYGEESASEPAVIMTGGKLTAECASKAGSEGLEIQGTAVNGTVDLSNYGDYCWRTERNDQKFNWSSGTEQQYVNGSDYAALQIQSSIPVELDPNGGTVEPDQVQMGRYDTADDLPTPERSGYSFRGWYTQPDEGIKADSDFEFNEELKLYAHWKKKSSSSSSSSSGSSSAEGSVSDGDQPEEPDPSVDESGDSAADCDHGSDCSLNHFNDVNSEAWYHDGIDFCVTNGLMNGTGDKTFAPDRPTSRAMLVTILYQLEGRPEAGDSSFADVSDGTWYSDAVFWASNCGIAGGIGNDRFAPDQALTREQLAVILYQYAKYKGYDVSVDDEAELDFADSADVSSWAKTALKWAVQNKLINGVGSDRLSPRGQATRAQVATILYQFCRIFAQNVTK